MTTTYLGNCLLMQACMFRCWNFGYDQNLSDLVYKITKLFLVHSNNFISVGTPKFTSLLYSNETYSAWMTIMTRIMSMKTSSF